MSEEYYVTLKEIVDDFQLEVITCHNRIYDTKIFISDINRPGCNLQVIWITLGKTDTNNRDGRNQFYFKYDSGGKVQKTR